MYVPSQSPVYSTNQLSDNQNPLAPKFADVLKKVKVIIISSKSDDEKAEEITNLFFKIINNSEGRINILKRELEAAQDSINRLNYENRLLGEGIHGYEERIQALEFQKIQLLEEIQQLLEDKQRLMNEKREIEEEFKKREISLYRNFDYVFGYEQLDQIAKERKNKIDVLSNRIIQYTSRLEQLDQDNAQLRLNVTLISDELRRFREFAGQTQLGLQQVIMEKEEINETLVAQVHDLQVVAEQTRQVVNSQSSEIVDLRQTISVSDRDKKIDTEIQRVKLAYINNDDGTTPPSFSHRFYSGETTREETRMKFAYDMNRINPIYWTVVGIYKGTNYLISCERARKLDNLLEKEKVTHPHLSEKTRLDQVITGLGCAHFLRREEEYLQ